MDSLVKSPIFSVCLVQCPSQQVVIVSLVSGLSKGQLPVTLSKLPKCISVCTNLCCRPDYLDCLLHTQWKKSGQCFHLMGQYIGRLHLLYLQRLISVAVNLNYRNNYSFYGHVYVYVQVYAGWETASGVIPMIYLSPLSTCFETVLLACSSPIRLDLLSSECQGVSSPSVLPTANV